MDFRGIRVSGFGGASGKAAQLAHGHLLYPSIPAPLMTRGISLPLFSPNPEPQNPEPCSTSGKEEMWT